MEYLSLPAIQVLSIVHAASKTQSKALQTNVQQTASASFKQMATSTGTGDTLVQILLGNPAIARIIARMALQVGEKTRHVTCYALLMLD